jgi:hypothetical protein
MRTDSVLATASLALMLAGFISYQQKTQGASRPPGIYHTAAEWSDTNGQPINAHGAGVLFHKGVYYLYGELKKGKTSLVPGQGWECYRVPVGGVACYSSHDLVNWKNEGVVLAPNTTDPAHDLHLTKVVERPKVIYNDKTKMFVMWMHVDSETYGHSQAGVATSTSPTGPFQYRGSVKPNGQMVRDLTLFKDDDGSAYLVFASEANETMHVVRLADDYLAPTAQEKRILLNQHREAPALFKHRGSYYLITSGCTGWSPNPAAYAVANAPLGDWQQHGNPCVGPGAETTFQTQGTFVLPIPGQPDNYVFLADRWEKTNLEASQYAWLSLRMVNGRPEISGPAAQK